MKDQLTLLGGVTVHLCDACITSWDEHLRISAQWQDVLRMDARRDFLEFQAIAKKEVSESDLLACRLQRDNVLSAVHDLAVEFVKPLIPVSV